MSTIWAIPGFLGVPSDWDIFSWEGLKKVDLASPSCISFDTWAKHFNREVKSHQNSNNILLGYSLGGRLGLHAVIEQPQLWNAAIIV